PYMQSLRDALPIWAVTEKAVTHITIARKTAVSRNILLRFILISLHFHRFLLVPAVLRHHILRQRNQAAGIGFQEGGQLLVVHLHGFYHADDLMVFFLRLLVLQ